MIFLTQSFERIENFISSNRIDNIHREIDQLHEFSPAGIRHANVKLPSSRKEAKPDRRRVVHMEFVPLQLIFAYLYN